ncbi:MAG TPA: hypothetical protein VGH91_14575 [Gammaproteobacteria bacterium]|jgi:fimbrial isopeptide formation D2 family protein/uncharacterized repeat protein (TIGR01451 family)
MPGLALAGTTPALFQSFAGNVNFVTTGNTLRAGDNTSNATASSLLSGLSGNPVNAGSSSETVSGIPAGSTIVAAYLYWAGSGSTTDYTVTLNGISVTAPANRQYTETYNAGGGDVLAFFSGAADVTTIVQGVGGGTGNGTYTFTGLNVTNVDVGAVTYLSNQATTAGWSLVVIYSNSTTETNRVINVFEGFQAFRNDSITLTPSNFHVPATGINGKFAVITWEGDPDAPSNTGETLTFNGTALSDACNTNGNQYNSTINTLICTGNPATDDVFYGVDVDTYDISADLTAGSTSATTIYQSGNDLVLLSSQIISIANTPVSDLGITKVHNGTFGYGDNGIYTLTVVNNGPATTSGTSKITDTLPTGETYVSATGTGWTCSATGQVVTCTSTATIANGASFNPITLTVAISGTAGTSLANTATVSVDPSDFDNVSGNNSSTDTVSNAAGTLVHPDLSTSTKEVAVTSGGDANPGDTLQYTITLNETNGVAASNVSVTDDIPANLSGFTASAVTVSGSTTTITNSSTNTGGTYNDGLLSISNIAVPANGSVTIVFTAQVASGTANCTAINNSGTITYAGGSPATQTVSSQTITVAQSNCTSSGNKILYVYDATGPTYTNLLNRVAQAVNTGTGVTVNGGASFTWTMSPAVATGKNLILTAGNVTVSLIETNTNAATGTRRNTTVSLLNNGAVIATSATVQTNNSAAAKVITYTFAIPATTVVAGNALGLKFNNAATANDHVLISQKTAALGNSEITFATSTVINVDSVTAYGAAYPASTQSTVYSPGVPVYICAAVSDPFGSYDATSAAITITDPSGTVQVSGAAMTAMGIGDCTQSAGSLVTPTASEAFEYTYTPPAAVTGFWTATVTAKEGTENTVTHTANGAFDVDVPSLTILKSVSVSADPTGDAIKHSIPGATMQYNIQVQNNGRGPVTSGSLIISDPVPTNTTLSLPAKPPFTFTDGAQSSGLTVSALDGSIVYSNNGGGTYTYTPSCTRPCTDSAITNFKITMNGSMNGKTGGTAPSFTISFQVVIN